MRSKTIKTTDKITSKITGKEPTERQKKVALALLDNIRRKKPRTKGEILREIGYKKLSYQPSVIIRSEGVQKLISPVVDALENEQRRLIVAIGRKNLSKVDYEKLVRSLDTITKNIQLLSGKETEIVSDISEERFNSLLQSYGIIKRRKEECDEEDF